MHESFEGSGCAGAMVSSSADRCLARGYAALITSEASMRALTKHLSALQQSASAMHSCQKQLHEDLLAMQNDRHLGSKIRAEVNCVFDGLNIALTAISASCTRLPVKIAEYLSSHEALLKNEWKKRCSTKEKFQHYFAKVSSLLQKQEELAVKSYPNKFIFSTGSCPAELSCGGPMQSISSQSQQQQQYPMPVVAAATNTANAAATPNTSASTAASNKTQHSLNSFTISNESSRNSQSRFQRNSAKLTHARDAYKCAHDIAEKAISNLLSHRSSLIQQIATSISTPLVEYAANIMSMPNANSMIMSGSSPSSSGFPNSQNIVAALNNNNNIILGKSRSIFVSENNHHSHNSQDNQQDSDETAIRDVLNIPAGVELPVIRRRSLQFTSVDANGMPSNTLQLLQAKPSEDPVPFTSSDPNIIKYLRSLLRVDKNIFDFEDFKCPEVVDGGRDDREVSSDQFSGGGSSSSSSSSSSSEADASCARQQNSSAVKSNQNDKKRNFKAIASNFKSNYTRNHQNHHRTKKHQKNNNNNNLNNNNANSHSNNNNNNNNHMELNFDNSISSSSSAQSEDIQDTVHSPKQAARQTASDIELSKRIFQAEQERKRALLMKLIETSSIAEFNSTNSMAAYKNNNPFDPIIPVNQYNNQNFNSNNNTNNNTPTNQYQIKQPYYQQQQSQNPQFKQLLSHFHNSSSINNHQGVNQQQQQQQQPTQPTPEKVVIMQQRLPQSPYVILQANQQLQQQNQQKQFIQKQGSFESRFNESISNGPSHSTNNLIGYKQFTPAAVAIVNTTGGQNTNQNPQNQLNFSQQNMQSSNVYSQNRNGNSTAPAARGQSHELISWEDFGTQKHLAQLPQSQQPQQYFQSTSSQSQSWQPNNNNSNNNYIAPNQILKNNNNYNNNNNISVARNAGNAPFTSQQQFAQQNHPYYQNQPTYFNHNSSNNNHYANTASSNNNKNNNNIPKNRNSGNQPITNSQNNPSKFGSNEIKKSQHHYNNNNMNNNNPFCMLEFENETDEVEENGVLSLKFVDE